MTKKTINNKLDNSSLNDEALNTEPLKGEVVKNRTKKEIIKAKLASQPKVRIIIPKAEKEPEGSFETVQINGYTLQIKKGVYVDVPEQVAQMIMDSNKQINDALEKAAKKLSADERPEFDNSN